jgi:hypothetical protein
LKNYRPALPAWLPRLRAALIYGTLGWLVFADFYNRAPFVGRGVVQGLMGSSVTLLILWALVKALRWAHARFQPRWRTGERDEAIAAFAVLLDAVFLNAAIAGLVTELAISLPSDGAAGVLMGARYELALGGSAALCLGWPAWGLRGWLKAWAIGATVLALLLLAQWASGAGLHPNAWDALVMAVALPFCLHWAFHSTAWPLAVRAFGAPAGASVTVLLFSFWCVQPTRWPEVLHIVLVGMVGAFGLYLTWRSRPGIR